MLVEGTVINDRYKILGVLGEGGMGTVYDAEHLGVGRRVAVKLLHPEYLRHEEAVLRFEREARAAAAIGHDHIVDVLDFGRFESVPYMVMEYLKGEALDQRLDQHPHGLDPVAACAIMGQVLSALAAAHAAGIVHRDLKPENVFLTTKGGREFVKLFDFGISKFDGDGGPQSKSLTKTGTLMGTPAYMAPEQALAKRDADHRVDVYAAGVMLYELLTGRRPFDGESEAEILLAIVHRPEGVKAPHELNPTVPAALSEVVLRAMARDRNERYEGAKAFHQALVAFGAEPVDMPEAPPLSTAVIAMPPMPLRQNRTSMGWERGAQPGSAGAQSTGETPVAPAPSKNTAVVLALGVLIVFISIGASFSLLRGSRTTPGTAAASGTVSASASVQIDLEGLPAGAVVLADGTRVDGTVLRFARGTQHTIRVSAPGRLPFETRIVADRDRALAVSLASQPTVAPAAASAPSALGSAATASNAANTGARAVRPARPLRDNAATASPEREADPSARPAATARPASGSHRLLQVDTTF